MTSEYRLVTTTNPSIGSQKAYRERQEQRSVHLTQKIGHLEEKNRALSTNNEQLELEIVRFSAESDALLATIHSGNRSTTDGPVSDTELTPATLLEAPRLNPALDSIASDVWNHPVHRITESKTGEKLLDKAAAWDMIQGHESFKAGLVDIDGVRQRLEGFAQCTGQGIAFEESRILSAIEESVISE